MKSNVITGSFSALLLILIISCSDSTQEPNARRKTNNESARNLSITRANAYNDLFLDSNQVEQFISQQPLSDTIVESIRSFYNKRNFEFAWFSSEGINEHALAFRNLYDYHDTANAKRVLDRRLDNLILKDNASFNASDPSLVKTELLLSWRFINYVWNNYKSKDLREAALTQLVPTKKMDPIELADIIIDDKKMVRVARNDYYPALRNELKRYTDAAREGDWRPLPVPKKGVKKGKSDTLITLIKQRLQKTGEYNRRDTSSVYTPELEAVVKKIQAASGNKADGIIGKSFLSYLNISPLDRVKKILINLERMRWMPETNGGSLIVVNIPEYILHVREGKDSVFSMPVVVGKQGHNTVLFSGSLNQVVFSPYWNLPPSIVENEVLPEMDKNKDYLAENNMEVTGEEDGLPVIRQLPGDKNELGKVKFLFPNSFNIYFHDTPHKGLFGEQKRAFSHGCIRLSDPVRLAKYLLRDQPEWTEEKIDSAMNKGEEKYVKVKSPVPVLIYYYTVWADEAGVMQWRDDPYNRDKNAAEKLFTDGSNRTNQPIAVLKK